MGTSTDRSSFYDNSWTNVHALFECVSCRLLCRVLLIDTTTCTSKDTKKNQIGETNYEIMSKK